jgi:hypothetical protein
MALADLRALARRRVPFPEPVTLVTPNLRPVGYTVEAQEATENRQCHEAVTRVTPVTPEFGNVGPPAGMRTADDPVLTVAIATRDATALRDVALSGMRLAELVERTAEEMMANPVYRITNREAATAYFRANVLTRLTATNDLCSK